MLHTCTTLPPPEEGGANTETPARPIKPTRKQVSRACDWCRARRIKCDNGRPCRACFQRGASCTHKGTDEPRTLPQALKEIDRLKLKVKELEDELASYKSRNGSLPTPEASSNTSSSSSPESGRKSGPTGSPPASSPLAITTVPPPQWEGIQVATARSEQTSYYGPASSIYFVGRIGSYITKTLGLPCAARSMQPRGASRNVALTDSNDANDEVGATSFALGSAEDAPMMNRRQEEYFLSLFWEAMHCMTPILDESWFRTHYASLWEPGKPYRKPSPLVDIMVALCLQYGYTFIPRDTSGSSNRDVSFDDATIAGRWYFRRSQALLSADLESPTIVTLQCHIFASNYLCVASFQNMCHVSLAQGIRTAEILGLHLEPPEDLPAAEKEQRRRIWWHIYAAEARLATKLGRPMMIERSQFTTSLPSDEVEAASANGATLGSYGSITWLTYSLQSHRLILTVHDIYHALYEKFGQVASKTDSKTIHDDPQGLECCAGLLASAIPALRSWAEQLPYDMKIQRRGGGESLSTDRSLLELDVLAPTWLQRQRVCLELNYHTYMLNLCRAFISFTSQSTTYTPVAERHAITSVNHAIAYTLIVYQVTTETDLMSGWSEYFMWQWNAAITIVGFILAYPIHPSTPKARQVLDKAVAILDNYGIQFAVSASAATIMRTFIHNADILSERLRAGITSASGGANPPSASHGANEPGTDDGLAWLDPEQQNDPNYFSEFMDWALSVDSFNSFEKFFAASNRNDPWVLGLP